MKKVLFLLHFLLMFIVFSMAQNNYRQLYTSQVIYNLQYVFDSTRKGDIKQEHMELLLNDSSSLFRSVNQGIYDSASYEEYKRGNTNGSMVAFQYPTFFNYSIIKNSRQIFFFDRLLSNNTYKYQEPKTIFEWKLSEDTIHIYNIACQKATCFYGGRYWTAWFAPSIPINEGPYKFCGLPGLILDLYDSTMSWQFSMVQMKQKKSDVIINYNSKFPLKNMPTKDDFLQMKKYIANNSYELDDAAGVFKRVKPEVKLSTRKRRKEMAARDNNWIELYQSKK